MQIVYNNEHVPTDEIRLKVSTLASVGMPHELLAKAIGISFGTLSKYYQYELEVPKGMLTAEIAKTCAQRALAGDDKMMALWLRTQGKRFGFVETQTIEITTTNKEIEEMRERMLQIEQQSIKDY